MIIKTYNGSSKTAVDKKTGTNGTKPAGSKKTSKLTRKKVLTAIGYLLCAGVMVGSVLMVVVCMYLVNVTKNDEDMLNLTNLKLSFTSVIYYQDRDTGEYKEYQRLDDVENRIWVNLDDMPDNIKNAFIAVEDRNFYNHHGVNFVRTFAAMINEYTPLKLFGSKQGASTITQQLVKNLTNDKSGSGVSGAMRKAREIFRAYILEKQYSKDEILEAYLNTIGLGNNNWAGVQVAANNYFGKDVKDLTLAECASIAVITKNPSQYNPIDNPDANIERRNYALQSMLDRGMISEEDYNRAVAEELHLDQSIHESSTVYSYFTDMVIDRVVSDLMTEYDMTRSEATYYLYNSGLKIYSTVNPTVQSAMEDVMSNKDGIYPTTVNTKKNKDGTTTEQTPQAAMISLDYNGGIVAVVGGLGEKTENRVLNRAVDSVRQTGSTMKPIGAYALAIEYQYLNYSSGLYDDYVFMMPDEDKPGQLKEWPRNYVGAGIYSQVAVPLVHAVKRSLNTCAVRALKMVGVDASYDFLVNSLHITSLTEDDKDYGPLALGSMTHGISPLEMAAAYAIFGNGGKYTTPHCYTTVEDSSGEIILEKKVNSVQAISSQTSYIMNRVMTQVLNSADGRGTGQGLATNRMESLGKTGTTSDDKDHWFIGLTPYYVTASWLGYDDPATLTVRHYATHPPTVAWRKVMNVSQRDLEYKSFDVPNGIVVRDFCVDTGMLANDNCPTREKGYYTEDNMPDVCQSH